MDRNIKSKHDFEYFVYVQSNKHSNWIKLFNPYIKREKNNLNELKTLYKNNLLIINLFFIFLFF